VTGGGFGPLSRLYGQLCDHLYAVETVVVDETGKAKAVTATREEHDPYRDLWWAHTGGGGGNFGVATKFWFRSRDGQGKDPTLLLPRRPSGYTTASVAWHWADLDEENFTTLVNNYMRWCERNSSPGSPAASVYGNLVLFRKEFGVVTLTGQVDPGQPQSGEALDTYFAEVTASVPNGIMTTQDDAPWQYTTLHAPEIAAALGIPATQLRSKAKGAFLRSALDGSQIRTIFERLTSDDYRWRGATAVFVAWGGKINALSPRDTAVAERESVALFSVGNVWDNPDEDEKHLTWTRTLYPGRVRSHRWRAGTQRSDRRLLHQFGPTRIFWKRDGTNQAPHGPSCTTAGTTRHSRKRRADGIPTRSSSMFVGRAGLIGPFRRPPTAGGDRGTAWRRAVRGWIRRASRRSP
jgi:hypothetical protein